jgi:Toprim-like/Protein of unknown function (DUF3991)
MINQDWELAAFKRDIDLRQFAESLGYQVDRRESWRGSAVLRRAADKIVVKRNGNGHYVFFSLREDDDHGTVIDFVQRRRQLSLGAVRQVLRPWIGRSASAPRFPPLPPTSPDRMRIEREYRRMAEAQRYPYLERDRCVPAALLSSPRFAGRMRIDARGNTVFPHFDAAGLCGYEIKNRGFTGFAAGGKKGLWFSHTRPDDGRLVLTESAIDALSYATLFPDPEDQTRYASLGGRPSSRQMGLLRAAVIKLADGAEVVAAFDADEAGRWLVGAIGDVAGRVRRQAERNDLRFRGHLPTTEGEDWNQVLLKSGTGSNSACQTGGR